MSTGRSARRWPSLRWKHAWNRPDVLQFVEKLTLHAQQEEEILYPTAILVGEYLKLKGQP